MKSILEEDEGFLIPPPLNLANIAIAQNKVVITLTFTAFEWSSYSKMWRSLEAFWVHRKALGVGGPGTLEYRSCFDVYF